MEIGVIFPQTEIEPDPSAVRDFAQAAEDLGYSYLFIADHVLGANPAHHDHPSYATYNHRSVVHESLTLMGYLAAVTSGLGLASDVILPDMGFIKARKKNLVGLVLTHAHEDHIGAVPYLWEELRCPIYATPFTAHLVEAKLKEKGLFEEAPVTIIDDYEFFDLNPFRVRYVPLAHSIPEGHGLEIETEKGRVFHTGDWKLDPDTSIAEPATEVELKALGKKGVLAMVGDSTNVLNDFSSPPEHSIKNNILELVKAQKGRVISICLSLI